MSDTVKVVVHIKTAQEAQWAIEMYGDKLDKFRITADDLQTLSNNLNYSHNLNYAGKYLFFYDIEVEVIRQPTVLWSQV